MPFVAYALKTLFAGKKSGKPQKFTSIQGEIIKQDIQRSIAHKKLNLMVDDKSSDAGTLEMKYCS